MKITIEITDLDEDTLKELLPKFHNNLNYLLADALAEFQKPRTPAEDYVEKRYPGKAYDWMDRAKKAEEVSARVNVAEILRQAVLDLKIEEE